MTDFVAKPVSKERLVEALLRALPEVAAATAEAAAADVVPVEAAAGGLA
jgi:FixJ family two-component response regulator